MTLLLQKVGRYNFTYKLPLVRHITQKMLLTNQKLQMFYEVIQTNFRQDRRPQTACSETLHL